MARGYSVRVPTRHTLPLLWLISDARNDAVLEDALMRLPRGSGFIYRHYHLAPVERLSRYRVLQSVCRAHDHLVVLSSDCWNDLDDWGSDGLYGSYASISGVPPSEYLWLATAHDAEEIALANRYGADGIFLSPVFPTRSHPGAKVLGMDKFRRLAAKSQAPVIALGGMNQRNADRLQWPRWAAIDGLS